MPILHRYEALDPDGQPDSIEENDLPNGSPNYTSSVRWTTTSDMRKERRVAVVVFPSEGNRMLHMSTVPIPQGGLLHPWGLGPGSLNNSLG